MPRIVRSRKSSQDLEENHGEKLGQGGHAESRGGGKGYEKER